MEWKYTYKEMLDRAYKKIPERIKKSSRFEIPKVKSQVQGNRTKIKSFSALCSKINRKKEHVLKFMLRELATTGKEKDNAVTFMGKFPNELLQNKFRKYVREFVICNKCGKPDTKLLTERGLTFKICEACGAKNSVRKIK